MAPSELLDFSASIHPVPPSPPILAALATYAASPEHLTTYPDTNYSELKQAIAAYASVDSSCISVSNGVMALLQAALRATEAKRCLVVVPAFTEYRRTLLASGVECQSFCLSKDRNFACDVNQIGKALRETASDTLLFANPHSPSGVLLSQDAMSELMESAAQLGVKTIVDEAFIDYIPSESLVKMATQLPFLIVLRSLTKFFAIPSLRVAYAVASASLKTDIDACVPLWPVDAIAAEAGRLVLTDVARIVDAREDNARERAWLTAQLSLPELQVYPGQANYLLIRMKSGKGIELWRELIVRHNIVVRSCANFEGLDAGFLRLGVRSRAENEKLVAAFKQAIRNL